jgi:chromosomal replication initiation ATPase DnaA
MAEAESDKLTDFFSRRNVPSFLGTQAFINWVRAGFQTQINRAEIPDSRSLAPGLDSIQSAVCETYDIDRHQLLSARRGVTNEPRNVAIYLSRRLSGKTLAAIGEAFGLDSYSSVSSVVSRIKQKIRSDRKLRRVVEAMERRLNIKMSQEQT